MDIDRLQSVGLVIIRPKSPQSDRKSDLLKIFRPESVKILKKRSPAFWRSFLVYLKSLYPSKFGVADVVSTDWLKFRRIFRYNKALFECSYTFF